MPQGIWQRAGSLPPQGIPDSKPRARKQLICATLSKHTLKKLLLPVLGSGAGLVPSCVPPKREARTWAQLASPTAGSNPCADASVGRNGAGLLCWCALLVVKLQWRERTWPDVKFCPPAHSFCFLLCLPPRGRREGNLSLFSSLSRKAPTSLFYSPTLEQPCSYRIFEVLP